MRPMHRSSLIAALTCAVVLVCSQGAGAQPAGPLDRKTVDGNVYSTLRDVINQGADMYNGGDHAGCYRLYEGALIATRSILDHRPTLQKAIDDGIKKAGRNPSLTQRAFDLRDVIDKIRAEVNPNPTKPPVAMTLWERLGGEANVKKVIDDFVAAAAADPKVDVTRGNKYLKTAADVAKLKKALLDQVSDVSGGPYKYKGKSMLDVHKGMKITDAQFDALAVHLDAALKKNGAKADDIKAVMTVIGSTRKDIVEKEPLPPPTKTLWDRLGGETGVKAVIDDFVAAASKDPKVDATRGNKFLKTPEDGDKLKKQLLDYFSDVSGGPLKYKGKSMKDAHKGMGITDEQFTAAAGHLEDALKKHKVGDADIKAVLGVIEGTRKDIVEPKEPPPPTKTLWERLGGEENVKKVIDDFVAAAAKDPKVDFTRGGKYPIDEDKAKALKKALLDQISSVSGGPYKYTGKSMKDAHKGMGITDAQFDALGGHLKDALTKNKAAADDIKAVLGVVESTRKDIVESKSPPLDEKDKKPATDKPAADKPATDK